MKTLFLLSALILLSGICYCQEISSLKNKQFKINSKIYSVSNSDSVKKITVISLTNQLENRLPKYVGQDLDIGPESDELINRTFKEVFGTARLSSLQTEKTIIIHLYVTPAGKVLEVIFQLPETTSVTLEELKKLETSLKQKVILKLYGKNLYKGDFYIVSQNVKYSRTLIE
jgi:hypothetical protein